MLAQRRLADPEVPGELANSGVVGDQAPELVDVDRPGRVLQPPGRLEPEPARQFADGRALETLAPTDLSERESLRQ
jgi:hypothetical protein